MGRTGSGTNRPALRRAARHRSRGMCACSREPCTFTAPASMSVPFNTAADLRAAADGRWPFRAQDGTRGPGRAAQARGLPADGLAGPHTLAALAKAANSAAAARPAPASAPTFASRVGAMAREAGSAARTIGNQAVQVIEEAAHTLEQLIAGRSTAPAPVPAALHRIVPPVVAKAQGTPLPPGKRKTPRTCHSASQDGSSSFVIRRATAMPQRTCIIRPAIRVSPSAPVTT